jgi:hypothetical protein
MKFIFILSFLLIPFLLFSQESWINQPRTQWPQIALTNNIIYKNGDRYIHPSFAYAGTGFLVKNGADTFAVTAKHVLLIARNKKTNAVSINKDLLRWSMRIKGNFTDSVVIDKLINEDTAEVIEGSNSSIFERDMLVLSIKKSSPYIYPLKPRYSYIRPGEKVYILTCAYADKLSTVVEGTVTNKYGFDILISTNKPLLPGASGSPVIDANGFLIGVFSSLSHDNIVNKDVAVAISTEYLREVLTKKPNLNQPKKDYAQMLIDITLKSGATAALNEYKRLTAYPNTYYFYNFRSTTKNGLREAGEKLLDMNRIDDAIIILRYNAAINSSQYTNFNILARAYVMAGNREEAINIYRISVNKFNNRNENEAVKQLERLQAGK